MTLYTSMTSDYDITYVRRSNSTRRHELIMRGDECNGRVGFPTRQKRDIAWSIIKKEIAETGHVILRSQLQ